jgi:hypothetical protein
VTPSTVRLGAGAGFAGDRIDPAEDLARRGKLDYLIFECLGERTVASGHARRLSDASSGFDPLLATRLRAVLPHTSRNGTRIITNAGAANPEAAGEVAREVVRELGLRCRVAVITGDDVLAQVKEADPLLWETGKPLSSTTAELISANAYLGAAPVAEALNQDADIVISGRLADPSLYLGPLLHEFPWADDDWHLLGHGTVVGHLLECAGQLTGGYFADPTTKPVPDLALLGFPFADVEPDGNAVLAKLPGTGGRLDIRTCTEQLLYEVGEPGAYLTPDVTADFTNVRFLDVGPDRVRVEAATGRPCPDDLKVTLGFREGWHGEGQISYAGPRALARAELAADVVRDRLIRLHGLTEDAIDVEYIGAGAAFRGWVAPEEPLEVRLRVSAHVPDEQAATTVGWEVESLYTNGPAGGGGARKSHHELVTVRSCLLPRGTATARVTLEG